MPDLNPLTYARAATAMGKMAVTDWADLRHGLPGDDIDGWDPDYIREVLPALSTVFNTYFRGEVRGMQNIPEEGAALLVGNHSGGTLIADTFVFTMKFYERFGPDRRFHQLAHDVAARMPGLGIRQFGTVAASHDNARKAFDLDAPVLVYPGGDHESFRPSWESSKIDFAGRKGFIKLALEQNVPIIPIVSIGGQETALFLPRGRRLAKLTGWGSLTRIKVMPFQLAPPFGITFMDLPLRVPLPAKITIEVLPPIDLKQRFGPNPDAEEVYEEVTGDMQDVLDDLADERTMPIAG